MKMTMDGTPIGRGKRGKGMRGKRAREAKRTATLPLEQRRKVSRAVQRRLTREEGVF